MQTRQHMRQAAFQPGWLQRQIQFVINDLRTWPAWMRREAGLDQHRSRTRGQVRSQLHRARS